MLKFVSPTHSGNTRNEALTRLLEWLEGFAEEMMGRVEKYVEVDMNGNVLGQEGQAGGQGSQSDRQEEENGIGMPDVLFAIMDSHMKRQQALADISLESSVSMAMGMGMGTDTGMQATTAQQNMSIVNGIQSFDGLQQQQQPQQQPQYFTPQPSNSLHPSLTPSFAKPHHNCSISLQTHPHHHGLRDMVGLNASQYHDFLQTLNSTPQRTAPQGSGVIPQVFEDIILSSPPTLHNRTSSIGDITDVDEMDVGMSTGVQTESMEEYTRRLIPRHLRGRQSLSQNQTFFSEEPMAGVAFGGDELVSGEEMEMEQDDVTVLGERRVGKVDDDVGEHDVGSESRYGTQKRQQDFVQQARITGHRTARKGPAGPDFGKSNNNHNNKKNKRRSQK